MTTTYTGSHLRERDQIIQQKYQGEIKNLETKIQNLKYALDQSSKNGYDAVNRGARLARSLGFNDVYDAQAVIDSSDNPITFQEAHDRLQAVEAQLAIQKKDTEILQIKLARAEERAKTAEHESRRIAKEKSELEFRYDDMVRKKERVTSKYQVDFQKWKELFRERHAEDHRRSEYEDEPDITPEERQKRAALIHEQRKRLIKMKHQPSATRVSNSARVSVHRDNDKENERTPTPLSQKRRFGSENTAPASPGKCITTPPLPLQNTLLKSVTNMAPPSSSPTVFLTNNPSTNHLPFTLPLQPIAGTIKIKEEPLSTPSPLLNREPDQRSSSPIPMPHVSNSSDTEEDSQAIPFMTTDKLTGQPIVFKIPAPTPLARLRRQDAIVNTTTPVPSRAPFQPPLPPPSRFIVSSAQPVSKKIAGSSTEFEVDEESGRPIKLRRLSENSHELSRPSFSANEERERSISHSAPRLTNATATATIITSIGGKGKGREVQNANARHPAPAPTPLTARNLVQDVGQKTLSDYSAFKGRGRYGKGVGVSDQTTINAEYTINPVNNAGLNFEYDEVVRNKDDRRRMNAGDCECCREYYEGVGPLPSRLKQPLWASPPSTPTKPCLRHSHPGPSSSVHQSNRLEQNPNSEPDDRRQSEIESHKKTISRHRHTWARASTPPAYWDIGFPTTQEAGDINEKAMEMHKRKKEIVEREANMEGGRYRRK